MVSSKKLIRYLSLFENISLGRDNATFENVKWAVGVVGLQDYVRQLPNGYDTLLHPEGQRMPSSILQKIILARSISHRPKLLLMKDILHGFLQNDRDRIIETLMSNEMGSSALIISNERDVAKAVDRIVILKDGKVSDSGTYEEIKDKVQLKG